MPSPAPASDRPGEPTGAAADTALDDITAPLDDLERQAAERAIAKVSETAEERRKNRRALAKLLSSRVVHAIDAMAYQGMTFDEAAEHARIKPGNLRRSLATPVAKQYMADLESQVRSGLRLQALHHTDKLARAAVSEHVRLGALKALLPNPELKAPATPPINVNVGIAVGAGRIIRPGIVIDCSRHDPRRKLMDQQRAKVVDAEVVVDPTPAPPSSTISARQTCF